MRKLFFLLLTSAFVLTSCKSEAVDTGKYIIHGEVANSSCDGAKIFLVPLTEPATHETVDSVVIKDRKFTFEGTKVKVAALRLQMPQRMKFQELLVITEHGDITAKLDSVGSLTGTPQNDMLQNWKETQDKCVKMRHQVLDKYNGDFNAPEVVHTIDSLKNVMGQTTCNMIKECGLTPLTRFLYPYNKQFLNDAQKKELQFMEDDYQQQLDSLRKEVAARKAAEANKSK